MHSTKQSVVPWRTPEQFRKVYQYLYSDDISRKCWAVEQIGVWQSRCWPSLPGAVEVCQLLTKAQIHDFLFETQKTLCGARELEMMFGMGIVRFVNVSVDRDQSNKATLSDLAEKYNIPSWIVSIRHDTSHGLYPTLPVLRMATESILGYYRKVFWDPECSRINSVMQEYYETEIIDLIEKYRAIQHEFMRNKYDANLSGKLRKKVTSKIDLLLRKPEHKRKFLEIITNPDHCVTKEDINVTLISDPDFAKEIKNDVCCILPPALQRFWTPLVELLHRHGCIPAFLEQLLLSQEKRKIMIFQKTVDFLVIYILDMRKYNAPPGSLKSHFFKKGPLINFKRLLFCCMKGSSTYSVCVLKRIMQELSVKKWKNEFCSLLTIKQGKTIDKKKEPKQEKEFLGFSFTVGDLEEDLNIILKKEKGANPWSASSITMDFSLEPLGTVHNPFKRKKDKFIDENCDVEIKKEVFQTTTSDVTEDIEMTTEVEPIPKPCILMVNPDEEFTVVYTRRHKE